MSAKTTSRIPLANIRIDGGTQMRAVIDQDAVAEYRERMEEGDQFPPLDVFFDGVAYWLAGGFHRYHAATRVKFVDFECVVHQGDIRSARLFAIGDNAHHGLRRTNEDKRRAVMALLEDSDWVKWSNRRLAEAAGVSDQFVNNIRNSLPTVGSDSTPTTERVYVTKHGTVATMKVKAREKTTTKQPQERPAPFRQATSRNVTLWFDRDDPRKDAEIFIEEMGPEYCEEFEAGLIARRRAESEAGNATLQEQPTGRQKTRISPHAMKPVIGHSTSEPMIAIDLPKDPSRAATALLSALGVEASQAMAQAVMALAAQSASSTGVDLD